MYAAVLDALLEQHGPQAWWPADSRFEIIVGALLVQRTAWTHAARAIDNLKKANLLAVEQIAAIEVSRLQALVRPAGFFRTKAARLKAVAGFIESSGGLEELDRERTETLRERLLDQPGIGPETADAILGYAFERPVFVVDAYARRLFERLGAIGQGSADDALRADCTAAMPSVRDLNELHALVVVHSQRCCLQVPSCGSCILRSRCAYAQSTYQRESAAG
jgi:endonuclease-3 related protein